MAISKDVRKIIKAAHAGGKVLKKYFGRDLARTEKSAPSDYYTKADVESEHVIVDALKKSFPEYGIFSEEKGQVKKDTGFMFIIDPLDGTFNFVSGIPMFSVSIGLVNGSKLISGVVYDVILNVTYSAERGGGAYRNERRIKVNRIREIRRTSVVYGQGWTGSETYKDSVRRKLMRRGITRFLEPWSPALALCLLASGKLEAFVADNNDFYDYAAGKLIVKEAGAKITDFRGRKETDEQNREFLATNGTRIHEEILKTL